MLPIQSGKIETRTEHSICPGQYCHRERSVSIKFPKDLDQFSSCLTIDGVTHCRPIDRHYKARVSFFSENITHVPPPFKKPKYACYMYHQVPYYSTYQLHGIVPISSPH